MAKPSRKAFFKAVRRETLKIKNIRIILDIPYERVHARNWNYIFQLLSKIGFKLESLSSKPLIKQEGGIKQISDKNQTKTKQN